MSRRRAAIVWLSACGLLGSGCGADAPSPEEDAFAKAPAPTLASIFHGEPLEHWVAAAKSADAVVRAEAAWGLGELGAGKEHDDVLIALLQDESPDVRFAAYAALQRWGYVPLAGIRVVIHGTADEIPGIAKLAEESAKHAPPALLAMVITASKSSEQAMRAAATLMLKHPEESLAPLREALDTKRPSARLLVVETLGELGELAGPAVGDLVPLLTEKAPLGPAAATALGRIGQPAKAALEAFVASPEAEANPQAKMMAQLALARIK